MLDSLYLNLMVGPVVPAPVPREAIEALTSVKVVSAANQPSGFDLTFQLPPRSRLMTLLLLAGASLPKILRVVLYITLRGKVEVLIDGVVTSHQVSPGIGGEPSKLTVRGTDLSAVMDLVEFDGIPYPGLPPFARVGVVLAKYLGLGVIPKVVPTVLTEASNPLDRIPRHQGTDLQYIKQLAEWAGYIFVMEPGLVPGQSFAYWGPEIKVGVPQPALNVDMDVHSNVESLDVEFDSDQATQYVVWVHNSLTKVPIPIPVPDVSLVNPPLGLLPPFPRHIESLDTAKLDPIQAALRGLSAQSRASESVKVTGSLDVVRYGHVLRPRRLVGLRGAGDAFDGLYYVQSVTHDLSRGSYKQQFTLTRNRLVSTVPRVPV